MQAEQEWGRHGFHKTVEESHPFGQGRGLEHDQSRSGMARPASVMRASAAREAAARQQLPAARRPRQSAALPARIGLWIAVLLLAVAAGAAGAYLLIGAL